jgi:hypothetical protein
VSGKQLKPGHPTEAALPRGLLLKVALVTGGDSRRSPLARNAEESNVHCADRRRSRSAKLSIMSGSAGFNGEVFSADARRGTHRPCNSLRKCFIYKHRKYTAADVRKLNQEATDVENDRLDIQEKYLIQDISNTNGPLHSVQLCSMK